MNIRLDEIVSVAVLAGEVLLKNGAETYRVEETMVHIAKACGAAKVESFVIPTGVFLTAADETGHSVTTMRRVRERTINLDRIVKVNELSRRLSDQRMDCRDALPVLQRIARERTVFSLGPSMLASGIVGSSTAILQNGGSYEVLAAFVAATLVRWIAHVVSRLHGVQCTFEFLGGIAAALTGLLFYQIWPFMSRDAVIIGGIMPLVPGMAITNAIRDIMAGDLLSGLSRGLEAALTAGAVAMGVVLILATHAW